LRRSASDIDDAAGQKKEPEIRIGKTVVPREGEALGVVAEVFTMTLGNETIQLLPLKNWSQLDLFKWRVRGILPGTPPGLEITFDHLKVAGETVTPWDPEGCAKLEKVLNEWLALERQTLESTVLKPQPQPQDASSRPPEEGFQFRVEMDNTGKPRLRFVEGSETVKAVALNLQGFNALIEQGLMRKPQNLKVGAFHDWVELDGELFRLDPGTDGAAALERRLNEAYIEAEQPEVPWDIAVFSNPASPTGFDIQFPASPNGIAENKKQHLNEESIELLQDPHRCSVLRKGITARLIPPQLVFKLKTPDGGERSLEAGPENAVTVGNDSGQTKVIDLSQPIDLLHLNATELATALNHPAINKRAHLAEAARNKPQNSNK
jgi:hypothetical protein